MAQAQGQAIVALGRSVEATLLRAGVPCPYPHSAARGRVRRRETYRALVAGAIAATVGDAHNRLPMEKRKRLATGLTQLGRARPRRVGGVR